MKMTLLEMVQDILSDMSGDQVNSIGDTEMSNQIYRILKSVYYDRIAAKDWPHLRQNGTMLNANDLSKPTHMLIPTDTSKITYVAYNKQRTAEDKKTFRPVQYMYPDDFLNYTGTRNPDNENVETVTDGLQFYVLNDRAPLYYTSFDDKFVIFDSYVKDLEDTLTSINSQLIYYRAPDWILDDEFVPDFPAEAFPMFLAEAKSAAFVRIEQQADEKSEQQARRQNNVMSQRNWAVHGGIRYKNYGRQSSKFNGTGRHFNRNQYTPGGGGPVSPPPWQP